MSDLRNIEISHTPIKPDRKISKFIPDQPGATRDELREMQRLDAIATKQEKRKRQWQVVNAIAKLKQVNRSNGVSPKILT